VMLLYVDQAILPPLWKWLARAGAPIAAILIPAAFFLSVASPTATQPNGVLNLAYVGALFLAGSVLSLWGGCVPAPAPPRPLADPQSPLPGPSIDSRRPQRSRR